MADYWKSIPRKFCDFCKCWLTDNKPSIDFHERGRKHQINVQKKINELRRKGQKMAQEEKNTERMMKQMESAALKAFSRDVVTNPDLSAKSGNLPTAMATGCSSYPSVPGGFGGPSYRPSKPQQNAKPGKNKNKNKNKTDKSNEVKVWFQGKTDDGKVYYWNCETEVSQWDKPEEGYVSLRDQEEPETELIKLESIKPQLQIPEELKPEIEANKAVPEPEPEKPITFNKNPYGAWTTVVTAKPRQVDLQLPKQEEYIEVSLPEIEPEPEFKFKEKVAKISTKGGEVSFKKRKINSDSKRNIRQKIDDEDT